MNHSEFEAEKYTMNANETETLAFEKDAEYMILEHGDIFPKQVRIVRIYPDSHILFGLVGKMYGNLTKISGIAFRRAYLAAINHREIVSVRIDKDGQFQLHYKEAV